VVEGEFGPVGKALEACNFEALEAHNPGYLNEKAACLAGDLDHGREAAGFASTTKFC
jgi:hypothetical protein